MKKRTRIEPKVKSLILQCVQLKERLGRAGLFRSMQKMEAVVQEIGWEVAQQGSHFKDKPAILKQVRKENDHARG